MKIIADQHIPFVREFFEGLGELILKPGRTIKREDVSDADVLLVRSVTPVNANLLRETSVGFVGSVTSGADHLDVEWLRQHNICIAIASGFNAAPVAGYVMQTVECLQQQGKLSHWIASSQKALLAMRSPRAAVIGVGHVGKLVAAGLVEKGFEVLLCDPYRALAEPDFKQVALDAIADVDLICVHVPLTSSGDYPTCHLIDKAFLMRQRSGTILLNAARGGVINSEALLEHGKHLVWCFDVWEDEPNINKAVLEYATVATPHIAGYSLATQWEGTKRVHDAVMTWKGLSLNAVVKPASMTCSRLLDLLNMTLQMKEAILPAECVGAVFDGLRLEWKG